MKRIEIEIMRSSEALDAVVDIWHTAERGGKITPRISFGSIKDLFSAITEKRLELLRFAADQPGLNTRQLAQALGRDYKNVYTDVTVTSDGNTEINLNLDITNEITAKGSVDQDGETSVGVFFERDY